VLCAFSYNRFKKRSSFSSCHCNNGDNTENNTDDICKKKKCNGSSAQFPVKLIITSQETWG